ncbi:artemin isoform X2 [Pipistrellus kuhlii]|nr:artemin isoform X2 [Pipistrellus kuhlii]
MEPGRGGPSVLPCWPRPRRQPALWPSLATLVLLSSVAEASLGLAPRSPAALDGPAPAPAPPAGHLTGKWRAGRGEAAGRPGTPRAHAGLQLRLPPGGRASRSCGGRARRPPPQPSRPAPPPPAPSPAPSRGGRAARAWGRGVHGRRGSRARAAGARGCRLRSQLVPVSALGLGHSSEELVRFGFCSGSCRRARSSHDISLAHLLENKALQPPSGSQPALQPCCRPTSYEAVSFMDVNSTWRTVDQLSATACGCLG